jgi:2,4-dienoyl-CoA reductase-like NADH-dependent reductase (Old Yellow Enzyme family)/NADPH-dependent 2,4-dienoyl-CoA reductase/sulfur reductase-like enzyme
MNEFKNIFKPIKIGGISLKNRIEFPPVGPHLGTSDGYVSRELIEWGRQYARGGAAIVTLGDSATLAPAGPVHPSYAIHVGNAKCINPLNRFAETIQRYGAKASIQLNYHNRNSPTEMKLEEINLIVESYASAAQRCMLAGMDMIMVHGAHGHILSQFLSRNTNSRSDDYGGSFKNRARLAISVLEAIRNRVGDKLAIEYRISADELVPGGPTVDEQIEFAALIQEYIDLIHVSMGNLYVPETLTMMNQPTYFPRGLNLKYAEMFKQALKIPVATVGSYNLEIAEQIIGENKADIVAMARTLVADPECVRKARNGQAENIRPCIRCNNCINRSHSLFLSTRCTVNPVIGHEAEIFTFPPPVKAKKVLVIGGGPGGMEAARVAAGRGHQTVLMEKEAYLGGVLNMAAAAPFKADMRKYLDWAISMTLKTANLTVKLSTAASPEKIKAEKPDVLIIAVGSLPVIPPLEGIQRQNVVWAGDVELGKAPVGDKVVVVGAGLTGSETALHLAQSGKKVTLIDMLPLDQIQTGASVFNLMALRKMLNELKVVTQTEVKLEAVTPSGVELIDKYSTRVQITCDTVVLALGVKPRSDLVEEFKGLAPEVYVVGDCNNQRGNLLTAVSEGYFTALEL